MTQLPSKVNPPVELENDGIVLNSGLDLTTSSLQVDKGSLRDCLNIEVVDRLGYQVIGGFDRYDGNLSPSQAEFWVFELDLDLTPMPPGEGEKFRSQADPSRLYGTIVERIVDDTQQFIVYGRFSSDVEPSAGEVLEIYNIPGTAAELVPLTAPVRYTAWSGRPTDETAQGTFAKYEDWNEVLRGQVDSLPSQPIGLHWYRNQLYAVADDLQMGFTSGGTTEIRPNDILRNQAGTFAGRVLKVTLASGTWAGGNANGTFLIEPLEFFNLSSLIFNAVAPTSGDFDLLNKIPESGDWSSSSIEIALNVLTARAVASTDPAVDYAGLWRSNPEPDAGWTSISSGWKVDYIEGFSSSDALRKVERSVTNNFVFDTDSSDGLSQTWFNGAATSPTIPETTQNAAGWKDSASPDVDATALTNIETEDTSTYLIGDIDFGFLASSGQPDRLLEQKTRLAASTVPLIDLPTAGTRQAGYSDARAPMTFLNIGNLVDSLPKDAEINGIEIATKVQLGFSGGGSGFFDPVLFPLVFDLEDALVEHFQRMFLVSAYIGNVDAEAGAFKLLGQKRSGTCALPTARGTYNWATRVEPTLSYWDVEADWDSGTNTTITVGGSSDLFGNVSLTVEDVLSQNFGIILYGETQGGLAPPVFGFPPDFGLDGRVFSLVGGLRLSFDQIQLKIHYTEPSARYYVRETADKVLTFDLVNYSVNSGELINGTGAGTLQVTNLQSVNTGADLKTCILAGDEIYRDPAFSRKVAEVPGTSGVVGMETNGFASLDAIVGEGSRYQFITANFFAREDWDGFYGVSGAGKAFSFSVFDADNDDVDDNYVQFITSNTIVPEEDKPRHIAFHQYHLALGYRDGTVRFSQPGEPESFDGLLGAAEVGVGDRVTGLLAMRGKALGVFCDGSIYTILGDSAATFNVESLSPYSGAIEYTVVDNGGQPIYCDNRGISTLEQSQKYGNFVGFRTSQKVTPWLLPRMTRSDDLFSINNAAGVVCAVPVRTKNQYRIFFRDGYFLTYTMMPDGSGAFTYGRYVLNEENDEFFVPICHSSQVDTDGVERIHMAHYSPRSEITSANSRYVYEFEKGFGFDGSWFDWYYTTAFAYKDPFRDSTIRKVNVDGLTKGASWATITVAKDYDEDSYSTTLVPLNLPRTPASVPSSDFKPASVMANVAKEGRSLSLKVQRSSETKTLVPPIVHQVLLVQYQQGGRRDS
jgi:hypothetical protein